MNESGWFLARQLPSTYPTVCYKEIQVPSKIRVLPSGTFSPNSGLRKFRHSMSIVESCYQLSSRKVDAQNVINWTVVGQPSRQYLRAPIVKLCLQHHFVARVNWRLPILALTNTQLTPTFQKASECCCQQTVRM